jgi:hypothetical protein
LARAAGARRFDSVAVAAFGGTSAAAIFWATVPETFTLSSLSIIPALALAARTRERPSEFLSAVAAAAAASITVTNAALGAALLAARHRWRGVARAGLAAVGAIFLLALAQKAIFPRARMPLERTAGAGAESTFMFLNESGGPPAILRSLFFYPVTAPAIGFLPDWRMPEFPLLSIQASRLREAPPLGRAAFGLWLVLFVVAAGAFFRRENAGPLRSVVAVTLLTQMALHLAYGREIFLYSMHAVPVFAVIVARAAASRARPAVLALLLALVGLNAVNNTRQFFWAAAYTHRFEFLRERLAENPIDLRQSLINLGVSPELRQRGYPGGAALTRVPIH